MHGRVDSATHTAAVTRAGDAARHAPAIREHLEEIVKGPAFKGSQRSQEFLRHIVERALSGRFDDLRERAIGVEVFGRAANYDTAEDAIVRVTASDVRRRLLQHYGKAEPGSAFRIDLVSGSYVPEFRCLTPGPQEPEADEAKPAPRRWWLGVGLVAVAAAMLWLAGARLTMQRPPAENLVAQAFHEAPGAMQVIVSDEALVLIQVLLGRHVTLDEYENLNYLRMPDAVRQKGLERFWHSLSTRQAINLGDMHNANRIADNMRHRNWNVVVRHARQVNGRDFRGGNFILLGSAFANPWASLFIPAQANFAVEPAPPGDAAHIRNVAPKPGEPARFGVEHDGKTGRSITHARVMLVRNTAHTGRVMLVAGLSMAATEMAGDYVLREASVPRIRQMLGLAAAAPLPTFEMVLRVTELNEIGDSVEPVACRVLQ